MHLKATDKSVALLAQEIGVSRQTLFSWMNGEVVLTAKHAAKAISIIRCDLQTFMKWLDDSYEMQKNKLRESISSVLSEENPR
ncbi:MAG: helix-turn-helix transcriptional regulator [Oligoflexus sp.]|nr:helix-turn-helix transcriptional regulator [Oligoflexus sp.]